MSPSGRRGWCGAGPLCVWPGYEGVKGCGKAFEAEDAGEPVEDGDGGLGVALLDLPQGGVGDAGPSGDFPEGQFLLLPGGAQWVCCLVRVRHMSDSTGVVTCRCTR